MLNILLDNYYYFETKNIKIRINFKLLNIQYHIFTNITYNSW